MTKTWFTFVKGIGDSIREVFLLPGDFVVFTLVSQLEILDRNGQFYLSVSISTLLWLLLLIGASKLLRLGHMTARRIAVGMRARLFLLKTKLARGRRSLNPHKEIGHSAPRTEVEFNDLDLAVLGSAATLSQGFVLSAPDIAAKLKSRPTKVQGSLEKLASNMMLERTLGATDDYEHYRLTRAGAAFLTMFQRNEV